MGFEPYVAQFGRRIQPGTATITKGGITFSQEDADRVQINGHVRVYLDRQGKRIAFRPAAPGESGALVTKRQGQSVRVVAHSALKSLGVKVEERREVAAAVIDGMLVLNT